MNKTKRELYEENKKYKQMFETYKDYWESDAIEGCKQTMLNVKNMFIIVGIILLIISAFLIGLGW